MAFQTENPRRLAPFLAERSGERVQRRQSNISIGTMGDHKRVTRERERESSSSGRVLSIAMPHPTVERRAPSAASSSVATTLHQPPKQGDRPSSRPAAIATTTTTTVAPQHGTGTGCLLCGTNDNEDQILLCEHCDGEYHTYCVSLKEIPEGEWYCGE